jgi:hypothetical protein
MLRRRKLFLPQAGFSAPGVNVTSQPVRVLGSRLGLANAVAQLPLFLPPDVPWWRRRAVGQRGVELCIDWHLGDRHGLGPAPVHLGKGRVASEGIRTVNTLAGMIFLLRAGETMSCRQTRNAGHG